MEKNFYPFRFFVVFIFFQIISGTLTAQCTNADFSAGNLSGWWGTYGKCTSTIIANACFLQGGNPTQNNGFLQGPLNAPSNSATQYSQTLCSTGNDANLAAYGVNIPCVYPGATYSVRLGSTTALAEAETMTYTFLVTASNCNFTYHYAVVLDDAGESSADKPGFNITVNDSTANTAITCATYQVTAQATPGFDSVMNVTVDGNPTIARYTQWSSVFVPLNAYIGHYVSIKFTTHSCYVDPACCGGRHYAYAYICCSCAPLNLLASSPAICGGNTVGLTAPAGAASYLWSGPGIVGANNTQSVNVSDSGRYTVTMTTFGTPPCPFTLDTFITLSPSNPVANFSAPTVCLGSPTVFTDHSTPAGNITQWSWDYGDNSAAGTIQNPSHTYTTAGTFPVKLTITWPPCTADTTINVTVATPVTSAFTATSSVCAGQVCTVNYAGTGTAIDSFAWNFNGATIISGTGMGPYQVTWSGSGTKNITLTVFAGSCASSVTTVPVTVTAFPGLTLGADTAICPGGSAALAVSGATSYTWAPAGSLNSSTATNVVATPATTTTYTVTGNTSSCTVTGVVTVRVKTPPTSLFTVASAAVCAGQNDVVTFTGTASAVATYAWAFTGDTSFIETGKGPYNFNVSTGGNESISLLVTDSSCTSTVTTLPITVNAIPSSAFTAVTPVCVGVNSTITYTGAAPGTPSFSWGFSGGMVASGAGAGPYQVNWASAGSEAITLSVTDNGCSSSSTSTVVVNADPTSAFNIVPTSVCAYQNATVIFSGTASQNAAYTWNFNGGIIASGTAGTAGPYQIYWTAAGSPTVTLAVTDGACTSTPSSVQVTVNPTPTASFTTTTPLCLGQTSNIVYSGTGTGAGTYVWNFNGGTVVSGTNQGPYVINWTTPGTKNVTLAVTENGCTSPVADSPVVVYAVPFAAFSVTSPVCVNANSTISFTGNDTDAAAVYTWNFGGGNVVSGTAGSAGPYQVSWATPGVQNVSLSISDHICNSTDTTLAVIVAPIPVSNAGGPSVSFCSGDSAALGTAPTNGYTYSWAPPTGLSNPAIANPYADGTNNTSAIVVVNYVVTTSIGSCSSTASVIDSILPAAVANYATPAGQCLGNSFNFKAGGSFLPTAAVSWSFGTNGVPATSTSLNPSVTFSQPGLQTVSLTISQLGCPASTYINTVDVYPIPFVTFTPDQTTGCPGQQICFVNNSLSNNPSTYQWTFGDGQSSTQQSPCKVYAAAGVYTVELQVTSLDGCTADSISQALVTISPSPTAAFTPNEATIQLPVDTLGLTNLSLNATSYLWSFGILGTSTNTNPSLTFTLPGNYPVVLRAYSSQGCADSVTGNIIVLPPTGYYIPNAFTPNGDGHNDLFYIELQEGVTVYKFEIFDRWGEKVHDGLFPWDGTYKGKPCPEGVYIYVVQIGLSGQENGTIRKGSVTLMR